MRQSSAGVARAQRQHCDRAPRLAPGWFQLGLALLNQNRLPEAAEAFLKATEIKPDFGPAFFNRGLALARAQRSEAAITAFRETIRHNPEHGETYVRLAELLIRAGREPEALGVLDQARTLNPSDPRLESLRQHAAAGGPPRGGSLIPRRCGRSACREKARRVARPRTTRCHEGQRQGLNRDGVASRALVASSQKAHESVRLPTIGAPEELSLD